MNVVELHPKPTWRERLLSEKVLHPLIGVALIGVLALVALRPRNYGSAADFELPTVDAQGVAGGAVVRLRDLRGKVVLIDFWATWCAPCRAELPILVRLHERYRARGLEVVGINVDETGPGLVPAFRQRYGIGYPVVYDPGPIMGRYGVTGLPTLVLVDRQGTIRMRRAGTVPEDALEQMIERAL